MNKKCNNSIFPRVLLGVFLILALPLITSGQNYQIVFAGNGEATTVTSVIVENISQCSSLVLNEGDILNLTGTVGIDDIDIGKDNNVFIYPNPMRGTCSIEFEAPAQSNTTIELYDMTGKRILHLQEFLVKGHHIYGLRGISSGIYILRIHSEHFSYNSKIICSNSSNENAEIERLGMPSVSIEQRNPSNKETNSSLKGSLSLINMQYNAGDILKLTGNSGTFHTVNMIIPTQSQTVTFNFVACTDADNNNYSVVNIGSQLWMAENLKTTKYSNGNIIPNVTDNTTWKNLITGACCDYNNIPEYSIDFGKLYNFYAVVDPLNICPAGWEVPTDEEWTVLTNYLNANGFNWDGTLTGNKIAKSMASSCLRWASSTLEGSVGFNQSTNNKSGFSALPSGQRSDNTFNQSFSLGIWWTSTEIISTRAYNRYFQSTSGGVIRNNDEKVKGYSVRCIKQ